MSNKVKAPKTSKKEAPKTDILNQIYRPTEEISVSGTFMNSIMGGIMNARAARLSNVFDVQGKQIGFSVNANDTDIENLAQYMLQVHSANIAKGLTVGTEVLQAELDAKEAQVKAN